MPGFWTINYGFVAKDEHLFGGKVMRKKLTLVAGVIMAGVLLLANNAFSKECLYFNDFGGGR